MRTTNYRDKLVIIFKQPFLHCFIAGQTIVQGLTGEVKFDNEGLRTQFTLDIVELSPSGLITVGLWNSSVGLSWSRNYVASESTDNNRTFVVITSLVSAQQIPQI